MFFILLQFLLQEKFPRTSFTMIIYRIVRRTFAKNWNNVVFLITLLIYHFTYIITYRINRVLCPTELILLYKFL